MVERKKRATSLAKADTAAPALVDSVIVGGGPAGFFAALALQSAGAKTAIVVGPARSGLDRRTTALLDGSVKALSTLGLWDKLSGYAAPLRVMRLIDDTGRLLRAPTLDCSSQEIDLDAFGYNIENGPLTETLREAAKAAGVMVIDDAATGVAIDNDRVTVTLASGASIEAKLAVGADGRRSQVREAAGIGCAETHYPQVAVTSTVTHTRPHLDVSTEFHTPDGPFTLVPLPGLRSSIVCVVRPPEADRISALDDAAFSREMERRAHSILGKMTVEAGRGRFELGLITPHRFAAPRVALVGEAAHVIPPIGAQGLNLGLRDGAALADLVADAIGRDEDVGGASVTEPYDQARRADILTRTIAVDTLNRSLLAGLLPADAARGLGLFLMNRVGPVRRAFMREGLQPSLGAPRLMRGERPAA
jgi:2-octaprenyl-6-methoxyphenol hydroxylase